jgi:hypothetical protein
MKAKLISNQKLFVSSCALLVTLALPLAPAFGQPSPPTLTAQYPVANTNVITLYGGSGGTLGSSPTFSVSPQGSPAPSYQWRTNSVAVAGATNASFTFVNAQMGGPTSFDCVVANSAGSVNSMVWNVAYIEAPKEPFPQAVLALHPLGYWRLDEPDDGLSDGNPNVLCKDYAGGNDGFYTNVILGNLGYSTNTDPTETSASFGTFAPSLSYAGGFGTNIDFGAPLGGNAEFSVAAWANGKGLTQQYGAGIVAEGLWGYQEQFLIDEGGASNAVRFVISDGYGLGGNSYHTANGSLILSSDSNWHYLVGVCDEANNIMYFYVDGQLASTQVAPAGAGLLASTAPLMIGSRPDTTPLNGIHQFAGLVNDVAIYDYPLTPAEVVSTYAAVVPSAPSFAPPPPANQPAGAGFPLTIPAPVAGSGPMRYTWKDVGHGTNVASGVTNGTLLNAALTVADVPLAWNGDTLELTVTNAYGSTNTSVVVNITNGAPSFTGTRLPISFTNVITLYGGSGGTVGSSPTFTISATGITPLSYQWRTNGVAVPGANELSFTFYNAQMGGPTSFDCVVTNAAGAATSAVFNVTYIAAPKAPFPQAVLSLHPMAYWRLNENDNGLSDGNRGMLCKDYAGGNNAVYTNTALGNPGYSSSTDPGETSASFGTFTHSLSFAGYIGTNINFAAPVGGNAEATWTCWANGNGGGEQYGGGLMCIGIWGYLEQMFIDLGGGGTPGGLRFGISDGYGLEGNSYHTAGSSFQMDNNWHYIVGVCDEAGGVVSLYIDGQLSTSGSVKPGSGTLRATAPMMIGSRPDTTALNGIHQFVGLMNDVAIYNYPFTPGQVIATYAAVVNTPPFFAEAPPASVRAGEGLPLTIPAAAAGTPPIGYVWRDVGHGTNVAGGITNAAFLDAALTVANVPAAWNVDSLQLTVTNAFGSTNLSVLIYITNGAPTITGQFPTAYTNVITLYGGSGSTLGSSPTFSISAIGTPPLSYQWKTNGAAMAGATNASLTFLNAQMDGPTTFQCVVTNTAGSLTSMVWTVAYVAAPTAPFPQSVLALHPMAYWRLNEPDDGLGDGNPNALCIDYAGGNNGLYTNVSLGNPGYSPNTDPTETSAAFGTIAIVDCFAGQFGDNIDFATPAGNNAEFSVGAWVNGNALEQSYGAGIVAIGLYGYQEQFLIDEGGANDDVRFVISDGLGGANGAAYHSANSSLSLASSADWHYLVGVCDEANELVSFYVDGQLAGTASAPVGAGLLAATAPLMIGSRPDTTPLNGIHQFIGDISDVALYNYPLTAGQVGATYAQVVNVAPYLAPPPPANATAVAGLPLTIAATAVGSGPVGYTWTILGQSIIQSTNVASGATNGALLDANLTLANVPAAWNGYTLQLTATNAYGSTNTSVVLAVSTALPILSITNLGNDQLKLNWSLGTLQSATNVTGPYTDITNATSPYTVQTTNTHQFYRLKED